MYASVVICTYNRSCLLEESLSSIINQDLETDSFEVIVVDNNSSDDTRDKVEAIAVSSPVKIVYVFEERQGLSYARNAGIDASCGEIVAFTDDDIEADKDWLRNLLQVFNSTEVTCAGGPLKALWPRPRPEWLSDALLPAIAVSEFPEARICGEFKAPHYPWGANLAFRKSVFASIGLFPTNLGRVGGSLLSNEEILMCRRIEKGNHRIAFAENAIIHHKVAASRLRKSYFLHRYGNQGSSDAILDVATGVNIYQRLQELIVSVNSIESTPSFARQCFIRATASYLHQIASLVMSGSLQLDPWRLIFSSVKAIADTPTRNSLINELQERTAWAVKLNEEVTARDETVRSLRAVVDERTNWALRLKGDLEACEERIIALQAEFQERSAWALKLKDDVDVRDARTSALERQLEERTAWALTLKDDLEKRDASVMAFQAQLEERTSWALKLKQDLEAREASLMQLQKEFEDRTAWAISMKQDGEQQAELILSLQNQVKAGNDATLSLQEQIAEREKNIVAAEALAAEWQSEAVRGQAVIAALQAELDTTTAEAAALRAKTVELSHRVNEEVSAREKDALRHQAVTTELEESLAATDTAMKEILSSLSWRITSPLRAVYGIVRGKN